MYQSVPELWEVAVAEVRMVPGARRLVAVAGVARVVAAEVEQAVELQQGRRL